MKCFKKIGAFILAFTILTCIIPTQFVWAATNENYTTLEENIISVVTEYQEDGSYTVTTLSVIIPSNSESEQLDLFRDSSSITGSKLATHYDSSNKKLYALKSTGTFFYNGSTVSCNGRSYQSYIYDTAWTVENITTSASGSGTTKASATASGTAKKHLLGITIQTASISATVYCDKNGNLS